MIRTWYYIKNDLTYCTRQPKKLLELAAFLERSGLNCSDGLLSYASPWKSARKRPSKYPERSPSWKVFSRFEISPLGGKSRSLDEVLSEKKVFNKLIFYDLARNLQTQSTSVIRCRIKLRSFMSDSRLKDSNSTCTCIINPFKPFINVSAQTHVAVLRTHGICNASILRFMPRSWHLRFRLSHKRWLS